ncbi:MAG TPA: hypothetical protein VHO90_19750 [Bacteroidales bacterium]|nr:hypothetical protein [Bacteroidales bacterium]
MSEYNNKYTQKLYTELHPLVGSIVAKSVLKNLAGKIGKTEETLSPGDSDEIAKSVEKGLTVFVGAEAAGNISRKISEIR